MKRNGELWGTGEVYEKTTTKKYKLLFIEPKLKRISCGVHHNIFLKQNGDILVMGSNKDGEIGFNPNTKFCDKLTFLLNDPSIEYCLAGSRYSIFYKNNGDLMGLGLNNCKILFI